MRRNQDSTRGGDRGYGPQDYNRGMNSGNEGYRGQQSGYHQNPGNQGYNQGYGRGTSDPWNAYRSNSEYRTEGTYMHQEEHDPEFFGSSQPSGNSGYDPGYRGYDQSSYRNQSGRSNPSGGYGAPENYRNQAGSGYQGNRYTGQVGSEYGNPITGYGYQVGQQGSGYQGGSYEDEYGSQPPYRSSQSGYGNQGSSYDNRSGSQNYTGRGYSQPWSDENAGSARDSRRPSSYSDNFSSPDWDRGAARDRQEYRGRAPKNYQRSDERIREDINDRLMSQQDIDPSDVEVAVQNGEVTLSGNVECRHHKFRIEHVADAVLGVKDVTNQIKVTKRSENDRSSSYSSNKSTESSSASKSGSSKMEQEAKPNGVGSQTRPQTTSSGLTR